MLGEIHPEFFKLQPLLPLVVIASFPGRGRWKDNRRTLSGITVADRPWRPALGPPIGETRAPTCGSVLLILGGFEQRQ